MIDSEKIRWASVTATDPVTGQPNKLEPPPEFKNTGLKNNQGLPLQWLNNQFNELYNALIDAQNQIDAIVGGSSQPTLELIFGIGAYYMSNEATSPATIFGFGTWVAVEGEFIVGVDTGDTDWDVGGKTGGSKTHTHTDTFDSLPHNLIVGEMPLHNHVVNMANDATVVPKTTAQQLVREADGDNKTGAAYGVDTDTSYTGSGLAHEHDLTGNVETTKVLPPFRAAYIWYRSV